MLKIELEFESSGKDNFGEYHDLAEIEYVENHLKDIEYLENQELLNKTAQQDLLEGKRKIFITNLPVINDFKWLDNLDIDAFLRLIRYQTPNMNGLCHPDYFSIRESLQKNKENNIFVLNTDNNKGLHWITITNLETNKPDHWRIFDSMVSNINIYRNIFKQILLDKNVIFIKRERTTMQEDSFNCGLHAIANACALAFKKNPSEFKWQTLKMREHYRQCISSHQVSIFPYTIPNKSQNENQFIKLNLKGECNFFI